MSAVEIYRTTSGDVPFRLLTEGEGTIIKTFYTVQTELAEYEGEPIPDEVVAASVETKLLNGTKKIFISWTSGFQSTELCLYVLGKPRKGEWRDTYYLVARWTSDGAPLLNLTAMRDVAQARLIVRRRAMLGAALASVEEDVHQYMETGSIKEIGI